MTTQATTMATPATTMAATTSGFSENKSKIDIVVTKSILRLIDEAF